MLLWAWGCDTEQGECQPCSHPRASSMAPPTVHPLQLVPKAPKLSGAGAEGHPILPYLSQVMELSWAGSTRWLSQLLVLIALHHLGMASSLSAHLCSPQTA